MTQISSRFLLVLPARVKHRLSNELGKRLDLDIEKILESPKLELQLSPAELDKRLLELFESVAGGPGGDLLRVIAGGNDVAFQQMYIKRNEARKRKRNRIGRGVVFGPFDNDGREDTPQTPTRTSQWVQRALRRNLPQKIIPVPEKENEEANLKMCLSLPRQRTPSFAVTPTAKSHFCPPRRSSTSKFTMLI